MSNENLRNAITDLYEQHGYVKPSDLIRMAEPEDSLIHSAFEWDNKKAGDEYRLIQARQYIRKIKIKFGERQESLVHIPVKINHTTREGEYKPVSVVVQSLDEYERALKEMLRRLTAIENSIDELKEAIKDKNDTKKTEFISEINRGFGIIKDAVTEAEEEIA